MVRTPEAVVPADGLARRARAIAAALSELTGETWQLEVPKNPDGAPFIQRLTNGDLTLCMRFGTYGKDAGRLIFSACPTADTRDISYYGVSFDRITLAGDTPPDRVASQIARRLLPGARESLAIILERLAANDASKQSARANADRLLSTAPVRWREITHASNDHRRVFSFSCDKGGRYTMVEATVTATEISLEAKYLPIEVALELTRVLEGLLR